MQNNDVNPTKQTTQSQAVMITASSSRNNQARANKHATQAKQITTQTHATQTRAAARLKSQAAGAEQTSMRQNESREQACDPNNAKLGANHGLHLQATMVYICKQTIV